MRRGRCGSGRRVLRARPGPPLASVPASGTPILLATQVRPGGLDWGMRRTSLIIVVAATLTLPVSACTSTRSGPSASTSTDGTGGAGQGRVGGGGAGQGGSQSSGSTTDSGTSSGSVTGSGEGGSAETGNGNGNGPRRFRGYEHALEHGRRGGRGELLTLPRRPGGCLKTGRSVRAFGEPRASAHELRLLPWQLQR